MPYQPRPSGGGSSSPQIPAWTHSATGPTAGKFVTDNTAIGSTTEINFANVSGGVDLTTFLTEIAVPSLLIFTDSAGKTAAFLVSSISIDGGGNIDFAVQFSSGSGNWSGLYTVSFAPVPTLAIKTISDPSEVVVNASNQSVLSTDSTGNGILFAANGNSFGFDSSGNPQLNGTFGLPKVVGAANITAVFLGGIPAGQLGATGLSISGALATDFFLLAFDNQIQPSALGTMAFSCCNVSFGSVDIAFVNTDPVNASSTQSGNMYILVLRFP